MTASEQSLREAREIVERFPSIILGVHKEALIEAIAAALDGRLDKEKLSVRIAWFEKAADDAVAAKGFDTARTYEMVARVLRSLVPPHTTEGLKEDDRTR